MHKTYLFDGHFSQIPRSCQCMLMSATTSQEVERLQALILHNPVTLNLLGSSDGTAGTARGGEAGLGPGSSPEIEHYAVRCSRCCSLSEGRCAHACVTNAPP